MFKKNWKIFLVGVLILVGLVFGVMSLIPSIRGSAEFVSDFGAKKELKSSEGRTNVLVIGIDKWKISIFKQEL